MKVQHDEGQQDRESPRGNLPPAREGLREDLEVVKQTNEEKEHCV